MEIKRKQVNALSIKLFVLEKGREIGRAYLYILKNDLHGQPLGFIEDVFVEESFRSQGLGTQLIKELIKTAKRYHCYKIVGTSRHKRSKVHAFYERLGFKNWGLEFRIDL